MPSGVSVKPIQGSGDVLWSAELDHPAWGRASLLCQRNFPPVPRALVAFDPRLTVADRTSATLAGSAVSINMQGSRKNVLHDRKLLLRYLRCLLGDDGLICVDHGGEKFWTRESLDEELSHDADLDLDSLFITHIVHDTPEGEDPKKDGHKDYWAHTHGLARLGAMDFDILRPSELLLQNGYDTFRAIAFLILEKEVSASTNRRAVILPNGYVSFVAVEQFNRLSSVEDRRIRGDPTDPAHNQSRLILCEPHKRRIFGWFGGSRVRSSRMLSTISDDHIMVPFTSGATELMADRARKTFNVFQRLSLEFREFEVKPLVKLGYVVDGGAPDEREHMWFEVHAFGVDSVDATLLNEPFNIARMKAGQRATHGLEAMTDWTILTPAGSINPRELTNARLIRENADEIRAALRQEPAGS